MWHQYSKQNIMVDLCMIDSDEDNCLERHSEVNFSEAYIAIDST